ncbi:hypothetical protein B0H13DRAFT_1857452 [Mycena leptocephala]|nr:hypothetical protein B0H13DRAFT_1857452 [Mycena leptocephala]
MLNGKVVPDYANVQGILIGVVAALVIVIAIIGPQDRGSHFEKHHAAFDEDGVPMTRGSTTMVCTMRPGAPRAMRRTTIDKKKTSEDRSSTEVVRARRVDNIVGPLSFALSSILMWYFSEKVTFRRMVADDPTSLRASLSQHLKHKSVP